MSGDNKPRRVKPHEISGYMAGYYSEGDDASGIPMPSERTERHTRREAIITRDGAHIIESEVEITERRPAPPAQPDDPQRSRGFIQRFLRGDW